MSLYDSPLTGTGTRSYPEIAALRLLVELRTLVAQLSSEVSRRQSSGSDTMRMAVLKLSKVAHQAGIGFETSRTARMRTVHGQLRSTLGELCGAARMAGFETYAAICERVSAQLEEAMGEGHLPAPLLDVLYDWLNDSLQYLGATPTPQSFPEAAALVRQLFDSRWGGLYSPALAESLQEGLVTQRLRRATA